MLCLLSSFIALLKIKDTLLNLHFAFLNKHLMEMTQAKASYFLCMRSIGMTDVSLWTSNFWKTFENASSRRAFRNKNAVFKSIRTNADAAPDIHFVTWGWFIIVALGQDKKIVSKHRPQAMTALICNMAIRNNGTMFCAQSNRWHYYALWSADHGSHLLPLPDSINIDCSRAAFPTPTLIAALKIFLFPQTTEIL